MVVSPASKVVTLPVESTVATFELEEDHDIAGLSALDGFAVAYSQKSVPLRTSITSLLMVTLVTGW